jgi:hypothetical protein
MSGGYEPVSDETAPVYFPLLSTWVSQFPMTRMIAALIDAIPRRSGPTLKKSKPSLSLSICPNQKPINARIRNTIKRPGLPPRNRWKITPKRQAITEPKRMLGRVICYLPGYGFILPFVFKYSIQVGVPPLRTLPDMLDEVCFSEHKVLFHHTS